MEKLVREKEKSEFEEYKKAEMEKLVREKEKREFEEYKKAEMETPRGLLRIPRTTSPFK
jgi:hypothetical protein